MPSYTFGLWFFNKPAVSHDMGGEVINYGLFYQFCFFAAHAGVEPPCAYNSISVLTCPTCSQHRSHGPGVSLAMVTADVSACPGILRFPLFGFSASRLPRVRHCISGFIIVTLAHLSRWLTVSP